MVAVRVERVGSVPTLIMRISAGSGLVVAEFGSIRTSAPYGWSGSSGVPLSCTVSGKSRPLIM